MRIATIGLALALIALPAIAQQKADGPTDEKAQKTYKHALEALHDRRHDMALDEFKKADKQDGGHCFACQKQMVKYGLELGDWKTAELAAEEMIANGQSNQDKAIGHYQSAIVFMQEGLQKHKDEYFIRVHDEAGAVLAAYPNTPDAILLDGKALAQLKQDEPAKARFEQFVKMRTAEDPERQRVLRYIARPELARAKMAPPFAVTTIDGQHISMDDLQGKVVLLDFWATWCGPCREALPHIQNVAKKFQGQPLVILSVSLDSDEQKWKDFITKNQMTWPQYRDGGFTGSVAKMFNVNAIPHTFTIDADGVLQEEHIGDASIEGKLKKLLAHARELQSAEPVVKPAS
ncbi:MAG TPA: redoxin domain-containing protein [Candidatus Acidoferrum sp.]|jgi:thiol-disulfide isomerase/thioredoxin